MIIPPDWITLRIFVAAVECGSVTRAAERCSIATSAAGKHIHDLEARAGVPLLERTARGVRPTSRTVTASTVRLRIITCPGRRLPGANC